jgi:transposase
MEQTSSRKIANGPPDRIRRGEAFRPAPGEFPDQFVLGERLRMDLENPPENRRLLALVFVMRRQAPAIARGRRVRGSH